MLFFNDNQKAIARYIIITDMIKDSKKDYFQSCVYFKTINKNLIVDPFLYEYISLTQEICDNVKNISTKKNNTTEDKLNQILKCIINFKRCFESAELIESINTKIKKLNELSIELHIKYNKEISMIRKLDINDKRDYLDNDRPCFHFY